MINPLHFEKRLIPCHKKKTGKKDLPEIRQPMVLVKKLNNSVAYHSDNFKILPYCPLLSNVLISKRITPPPPPPRLISLIKEQDHSRLFHNFRLREQSAQFKKRQDKSVVKAVPKRCTTSLSIREPEQSSKDSPEGTTEMSDSHKNSKERGEFSKEVKFVVVGSNNNEDMVKKMLMKRKGWRELEQGEGLPDFKWIFYKDKYNFKRMGRYGRKRAVNHFQFNHQISTKDSLIKNLQFYCETRKIQLFGLTPVTFVLDFDSEYCQFNLKQFLSFFQKNDPRENKSVFSYWQLVTTLECYMARQNPDIKKKQTNFCRPYGSDCYFTPNHYIWLLKPTGLNRGRGIQLFDSLDQLQSKLLSYFQMMNRKKSKETNKMPGKRQDNHCKYPSEVLPRLGESDSSEEREERGRDNQSGQEEGELNLSGVKGGNPQFKGEAYDLEACSFVIQKYIERPLLIQERKFDVRVWALLTQKMELYFFRRGYIRLSGEPYSLDSSLSNPFVHFTNNAIQQHSAHYGQFQDGNQLPFQWLTNEMPEEQVSQLWRKMKEATHMAFSSVKKKINLNNRQHCFQLFGLDFMVDFQHKLWLIEVNENPCLECSSPLLADMVPEMVDGVFSLTLDQIFSDKSGADRKDPKPTWQLLGRLSANCKYVADE